MRHVKEIVTIVEAGKISEAHEALDELLILGPRNLEALKLRAQLYATEGRFYDEARAWEKVLTADSEDPDAVTFFLGRQVEDREYFYFTDDIAGGGRKFLAYPKSLITTSAFGLLGCFAFSTMARLITKFPILESKPVLLGAFGLFVLGPWIQIIITYIKSLRSISVTTTGIEVATRFKAHATQWAEISQAAMVRTMAPNGSVRVDLVLLPKDLEKPRIEIDLTKERTSIKARTYLVREITRAFGEPKYLERQEVPTHHRRVLAF